MSITIEYPFDTPGNYTYDPDKIEVSGSKAKPRLKQADIDFNEDFADDTGFTYDPALSEFTGGLVRQKDTRPAGATVYASFPVDKNSNWGNGILINSLSGGATWGSGRIDLTGRSGKRLNMPGTGGNFDTVGNTGCIRFTVRPNASGVPPTTLSFLEFDASTGNNNSIFITQTSGGGNLIIDLRDSSGTTHLLVTSQWLKNAGQDYIFELDFDFTPVTGRSRLFIDGVLKGTLNTSAWTRVAEPGTLKWGGATGTGDFWIDDIILFSTVQHTADHTGELPFTYHDTIYVENNVVLPEMAHVGDGTIRLFNSISSTEAGSPRLVLEIGRSGDKLYWTGSAWAVSDESYAQASSVAVFNTNGTSLPVDGEEYGQFTLIFPDSSTVSSMSELTVNMNVDDGYYTDNPYIEPNSAFRSDEITAIEETVTKTGSDNVTYLFKKGDDWNYWDGGAWAVSTDPTDYAQTSTFTEFDTNKATLLSASTLCKIRIFLHSADGTTAPDIDTLSMSYAFGGDPPDSINTCIVWGYSTHMDGIPNTDVIKVNLNKEIVQYKTNTQIKSEEITVTPDSVGYWEVELVETENMESTARYIFNFGGDLYERQVPDESTKSFWDLIE